MKRLNFYPWGLSLNQVLPVGPARTRVRFRSYVWKPELLDSGAGGALDQVEMEDEAVVMTVQQGCAHASTSAGGIRRRGSRGCITFIG
jgi:hypothetical protein